MVGEDLGEATSREVIRDLLAAGATVTAYGPVMVRGMGFEYLAIGR